MMIQRPAMGVAICTGVVCLTMMCSAVVRAQVKLEYKFPEGKKLTYKTTLRVRQVLAFMNNMDKESLVRETKVWTRSVGKRRSDSTLPIEEKVEFLRNDYTLPGGLKLGLDSNDSKLQIAAPELRFLGDLFKLESAIAYTILLDGQARVKTVEGTDLLRKQAEKLDSPIASEEFQNIIATDRLKAKFEQEIHCLPDIPAKTGEPWERTELLEINGKPFTLRKKYDYRGIEKKGAKTLEKIGSKVLEIKYDPDPKTRLPLKVVKSELKVESSDETILFDREEGHIVNASKRLRTKGSMTYSGGGVDQTVPFDLSFDVTTQLQPATK